MQISSNLWRSHLRRYCTENSSTTDDTQSPTILKFLAETTTMPLDTSKRLRAGFCGSSEEASCENNERANTWFCRAKVRLSTGRNFANVLKDQEQAATLRFISPMHACQTPIGRAPCKWRCLFTFKHQKTFDGGLWWDGWPTLWSIWKPSRSAPAATDRSPRTRVTRPSNILCREAPAATDHSPCTRVTRQLHNFMP